MKLRTLMVMLVVPCFFLWGCEETTEATEETVDTAAEPTEEAAPAAEEKPGPADVCQKIVEAAKANDEAGMVAHCTDDAAEAMAGDGVKEAMFEKLGGAECGEATVNEDGSATVKAKAGEEERDIPFAKVEENWKLNVAQYIEKYPVEKKEVAKAKKGKKKKGKKKRRKKGK